MKARAWIRRLGVILLFASVADRAIAAPSVYPTGVTMIDPQTIDGARGVIGAQTSSVDFGAVHGQIPGRVGIYANKEIGLVDWQGNIIWQGGAKVPAARCSSTMIGSDCPMG